MTSSLCNALFPLNASIPSDVTNISQASPTWLEWHKRFGHIAVSGLQCLQHLNLIDGFNVDETSWPLDCDTCIQAKQHHASFLSTIDWTTTYPGELTHVDLWGPAQFTATNGAQYYVYDTH